MEAWPESLALTKGSLLPMPAFGVGDVFLLQSLGMGRCMGGGGRGVGTPERKRKRRGVGGRNRNRQA